jgi:hypothetical protein
MAAQKGFVAFSKRQRAQQGKAPAAEKRVPQACDRLASRSEYGSVRINAQQFGHVALMVGMVVGDQNGGEVEAILC